MQLTHGIAEATQLNRSKAMWKRFSDGWFTYYYNIETGEQKFELDDGDIEVN